MPASLLVAGMARSYTHAVLMQIGITLLRALLMIPHGFPPVEIRRHLRGIRMNSEFYRSCFKRG